MIEIMSARYEANALLAAKRWNRIVVDITGLMSKFAAQELFEFAKACLRTCRRVFALRWSPGRTRPNRPN